MFKLNPRYSYMCSGFLFLVVDLTNLSSSAALLSSSSDRPGDKMCWVIRGGNPGDNRADIQVMGQNSR